MNNLKKDEEEKEEIYTSCNKKWATGEAFSNVTVQCYMA